MQCNEVAKTAYGAEVVKLSAVYGTGEENKSFAEATPAASLEMHVTNKAAHGAFVPGKCYFLDFSEAVS